MNRIPFAALFLAAASAPLLAQTQPAPAPLAVDPLVAQLRDDALANDKFAWDITEGLTTEVGQRMAGTEAEARARIWSVAKLKSMGFSNVRIENALSRPQSAARKARRFSRRSRKSLSSTRLEEAA
jgi:hypothetical protein